jgi:nicotinamidase-related amidase
MTKTKRIDRHQCCGALIDVQGFFLTQVEKRLRTRLVANTINFIRLLNHFEIPIVATLERPVVRKGMLPPEIRRHLGDRARLLEKNFFDLTREKEIRACLKRFGKKQVIVAGCETDVCVLQSCLGLLDLGYEVYVVEELLFSSARHVDAAIARMKNEGVVFVSYKTLYYELIEAVESAQPAASGQNSFEGPSGDIPDVAIE